MAGETHLRYGDTILLTQKGAMLGSYYTADAVSNLFMLPLDDEDIPACIPCIKTCACFRIMPLYEYESLEALKEEKKRRKLNWHKILLLENNQKNEEKENRRRLTRYIGRVVRYDHAVQFFHLYSGKILTASPRYTSYTEPRNFACYLDSDPSKHSRFKVLPAVEGYDPGDPVNHSDFINLYSDPDGFVGTSIKKLDPNCTLYPPLSEVFIGPKGGGFSIKLYNPIKETKFAQTAHITETTLTQTNILGGDIIQFYNKKLNSYLALNDDNELILKLSSLSDGRHFTSLADSYWVLETVKSKYSSPVHISSGSGTTNDIRLVNFVTGEYAKFPSDKNQVSLKSLIRITNTEVKSGDCVKFYSGNWLSFGPKQHDESRKLVLSDHRDHTDVFTIHKVDHLSKLKNFKLLGFKLLLDVIDMRCDKNQLNVKNHLESVISAINELNDYIDTVKKKHEFYENCEVLGITDKCFEICNNFIPHIVESEDFRSAVEVIVQILRGMMKYRGESLKAQGHELVENLFKQPRQHTLQAFLYIIKDNVNLISTLPSEVVVLLVDDYTANGNPIYLKILRKLCRCKRQAVMMNQNIIVKALYGPLSLHKRLIKIKHEGQDVSVSHLNKWVNLMELHKEKHRATYSEFLGQLDLVDNMLFGKNFLGYELIITRYGLFSEHECIDVITNDRINEEIRGCYIKILIAAHIARKVVKREFIPNMLSYQYSKKDKVFEEPPSVYNTLDKWIVKYVEANPSVVTSDEAVNSFKHSVMSLVEFWFRKESIGINSSKTEKLIKALVKWLDGREDLSHMEQDEQSSEVFQQNFRFRNLKPNRKCTAIKQRVLECLHLAFWHSLYHFWERVMRSLHETLYELAGNERKENFPRITNTVGGIIPVLSFDDAIAEILRNGPDLNNQASTVMVDFLEELLAGIYLFHETPDITTIVFDTLNYEHEQLTTRASELLVLLYSPMHQLLEILPKTAIVITEETYHARKEVTDNYITVLKLRSDPITENLLKQVTETMQKLRESTMTEDNGINKPIQKLIFDLGTVKELIRILCANKQTISTSSLPTDDTDYVDEKIILLKIESFRLMKVVISGLELGQELAMEHFKDLLRVKGEGENLDHLKGQLEQAKAFALDEIFTDNTNLSLNVQEDEIKALLDMIVESVTATPDNVNNKAQYSYLYLAILENMIDMEDSTDFLCKHQTFVLRLIREYWVELNGKVLLPDDNVGHLHLLDLADVGSDGVLEVEGSDGKVFAWKCKKEDLLSSKRGWQGLYFTHTISLMACCVVGDAQSTETICKEQYPLSIIFPLLRAAKNDIIYFTCLSKFVLNVYIKSSSILDRQQLLGDDLAWYINEGITLVERVSKNFKTCSTGEKMTYLGILGDLKTQIKLLSSRQDVDVLLKDLACYYDYIFFVLCPIIENVFMSDKEIVEKIFPDENREIIVTELCRFGKYVSPFLDQMLWDLLFSAIEAVNVLDGENRSLLHYYFSDKSNKMFKFNSMGRINVVNEPVLFNNEVQDVMDLVFKRTGYRLKEVYTKKIMKEIKEGQMNMSFGTIVDVLVQITEKKKDGTFVVISEEVKHLGSILFEDVTDITDDTILNSAPFATDDDDEDNNKMPIEQLGKIISKMEGEECSEYTTIRLINVFTALAEDSNKSKDQSGSSSGLPIQAKRREANSPACSLLILGLTEALGNLMITSENDHIKEATTESLLSLVQCPTTKERLREFCSQNDEPMFEWCAENIRAGTEGNRQLCMIEAIRSRAGFDSPMEDIGIVSSTPKIRVSVQLIGAMCDGQFTEMQNYLRFQENKRTSHNFLIMLIRLLKSVRSGILMMDTLKSINALISANDSGKETAIENDIVEIVNEIIASEAPANDADNALEIKASSYALLSTLVEQSGQLTEFYDKIREELDINTLQCEISSHLELLGHQIGGEKAQTAAFKGYALLKKISSLEHKDYVGKLDEEISQKLKVDSVEVQWQGHLEKVYYPIPKNGHVRNKIKEELKWGIDRKSKSDKQRDFLLWSEEIVQDMVHQRHFSEVPVIGYIMKHDVWWDWLVFIIALLLQIWLIKEWKDSSRIGKDADGNLPAYAKNCINKTMVCPTEGFHFTIICLGTIHILACLCLTISYFVANYHRMILKFDPKKRMAIRWHAFYHIYLLMVLICSALGIWTNGMLYCFHLFHIATLFDLLGRVIRGATKHADQLLVCFPFALIIAYNYAIIYFSSLRTMFSKDKMEYCESLGECFMTVLRYSLRPSSGGHNYSWSGHKDYKYLLLRIIIDSTFWILFTVIGLNVVTSLILDGFRQLKAEREKSVKDMTTLCTICGLSKDHLTSSGISWEQHTEREHNIWSYITFFYYLQEHRGRFSAVENEVLHKFKKADPSFLPLGRCIALDNPIMKD